MRSAVLNARSVKNKPCMIHDLVTDQNLKILCLVETWLKDHETAAIKDMMPDTHEYYNCSRPSEKRGRGVGVIAHKSFILSKATKMMYITFECMEFRFSKNDSACRIFVIYRAPDTDINTFFDEFQTFLIDTKQIEGKNFMLVISIFG